MDQNRKKFHQLCIKDICGEISRREKASLDRWLKENPENQAYYAQMQKTYEKILSHSVDTPDPDLHWKRLSVRLGLNIRPQKQTKRQAWQPILRPALGFAMVLLLAFGIGVFLRYEGKPALTQFAAAYGQKETVTLSDGSVVRLNSGSSLSFEGDFTGKERRVILSGEAFFDVAHETRPFIVETANAETRVLGTRFDVWARGTETRVIVKSGKVQLTPKDSDHGVLLTADKTSRVVQCRLDSAQTINAEYRLGWLKDRLIFDHTPLKEAAGELERFYNVRIVLEKDSLSNKTLSASYENTPVETVLLSIAHALNLQMDFRDGVYFLRDVQSGIKG